MEHEQGHIAERVATFADANRRPLGLLAAAIQRATGDDEETCFARAWLLYRWARGQREPRVAAAAVVRRMNEERLSPARAASRPPSVAPGPG